MPCCPYILAVLGIIKRLLLDWMLMMLCLCCRLGAKVGFERYPVRRVYKEIAGTIMLLNLDSRA
jgi:hypothetical protein